MKKTARPAGQCAWEGNKIRDGRKGTGGRYPVFLRTVPNLHMENVDSKIATMKDYTLSGLKEGTTTISAKDKNGKKVDVFKVIVTSEKAV